jgi:hypothetical protein
VKGDFTFDVTFEQGGPAQGEPVIVTLNVLINRVDQMVTLFRPLFSQAGTPGQQWQSGG